MSARNQSNSTIVPTPVIRNLDPPRTKEDYNPAAERASAAPACIWELLRRNPAFRHLIRHIESLVRAQEGAIDNLNDDEVWKPTPEEKWIFRFLKRLDGQNPFAACAVRWALRPKLVELGLHRPSGEFFTPMNCHTWKWINLGIPALAPKELKRMERLIKSDFMEHTFRGPLASIGGKFNLDTPWPETPPLFRFHFQWLWVEFDPSLAAINQRPFVPFMYDVLPAQSSGPVTTALDWTFLDRPLDEWNRDLKLASDLQDLRERFENHSIFCVPKALLTRQERRKMAQEFAQWLEEVAAQHGLATSTKKAVGLFGNPKEWRDFIWCRHWIHYPQELAKTKTPAQRRKHKRGIFIDRAKLLKPNVIIKKGDNPVSPIAGRYKTIESLMFKVYPYFDWPGILNDRQGVPKKATRLLYERALEVCRRKLDVGFVQTRR